MTDLTSEENPRGQMEVTGFTTLSCEHFLEFPQPSWLLSVFNRKRESFFPRSDPRLLYEEPGSAAHVLIPEKHLRTKPNQKVDSSEIHSLLHVLIT